VKFIHVYVWMLIVFQGYRQVFFPFFDWGWSYDVLPWIVWYFVKMWWSQSRFYPYVVNSDDWNPGSRWNWVVSGTDPQYFFLNHAKVLGLWTGRRNSSAMS
jgi:hypothetical protein